MSDDIVVDWRPIQAELAGVWHVLWFMCYLHVILISRLDQVVHLTDAAHCSGRRSVILNTHRQTVKHNIISCIQAAVHSHQKIGRDCLDVIGSHGWRVLNDRESHNVKQSIWLRIACFGGCWLRVALHRPEIMMTMIYTALCSTTLLYKASFSNIVSFPSHFVWHVSLLARK